jgi:hypothetical protein
MPSVKIVREQALKDYTRILNEMPQDFRIEYRNRIKSEFGITTFNQLIKKFKGPEAGTNWMKYQELMRRLAEEMKQGWHHAHNIQLPFERVFLASHAREDLDWKLHSAYPERDGIKVTMEQKEESEQGYPATIATAEYVIGWEFAKDFVRRFAGSERQKNRLLKKIAVSPGYMRWQAQGGNPEITKAIEKFKELTGLDFQTEFYGKGQAGLKPEYITRIHKVFETIQKHVNIKNYKPPDRQQLKVKVEGAGKWAKGLYFEQSKTIGISPSWPGTIAHELAHYFWYRDPNLQREFMNWANESGYYDRVSKYTLGRIAEKEMEGHIDSTFSYYQKMLDGFLSKAGKKAAMRGNVRICKRGAQYLLNSIREYMRAEKGAFVDGPKTLDRFMELDNKQLMTFSTKLKKLYGDAAVPGTTPVNVVAESLKTLRDVLKKDPSIKSDVEWCMRASAIHATKSELRRREYSHYMSKAGYWQEPTEMFARAFETYLRFREGIKEGSRDNPYGYAHGKVDPDWSVFKKNKKFERMLKRHIGSKVIKSLAIMVELRYANGFESKQRQDIAGRNGAPVGQAKGQKGRLDTGNISK